MSDTLQHLDIRVDDIAPSPFNRRVVSDDYLKELTASIKANGVVQPLVVRQSPSSDGVKYQLVIGEHRWRAAIKAHVDKVPCTVVTATDSEAVIMQHAEMLKKVHNALEIGQSYLQLSKLGLKPEEIAKRVGKSSAQVYAYLSLNKASEVLRNAVVNGKISGSHAARLVNEPEKQHKELVYRIADEQWSMRDLEAFLKQRSASEKERARSASEKERARLLKQSKDLFLRLKPPKPKPKELPKQQKPTIDNARAHAQRESTWRRAVARIIIAKVKQPSKQDLADLVANHYLDKIEIRHLKVKTFGQQVILALLTNELSGWSRPKHTLRLAKRYRVNVNKIRREVAKKPKEGKHAARK